MKRVFCFVLALALLLSTVALGESGRPALRLSGIISEQYWQDMGIPTTLADLSQDDYLTIMNKDDAPDLYCFVTRSNNYRTAKGAELWADLSGSEIIQSWTERLRPDVRDLVTTEDGKIIGLAWFATVSPLYWRQDAWDAAGLPKNDVPQSYEELLDFLEKWMVREDKELKKNICVAAPQSGYVNWLLNLLINTWEMQQYTANESLDFNTPTFVALLERTLDVGKQLAKSEPSKNKQQGRLQLFENFNGGERYNAGRDDGISHSIPFRITSDQPNLMRGTAMIYVVRADTLWMNEIISFFEHEVTDGSISSGNNADMLTGVAPRTHDPKSANSPSTVTAGYLADFDNYQGVVCFAPMRTMELYEDALEKFCNGDLTAQELVEIISQPKNTPKL